MSGPSARTQARRPRSPSRLRDDRAACCGPCGGVAVTGLAARKGKKGKPMRIAEIVQGMLKAGHVFESKKPFKAMTKLMYNNAKVFKRVKPGTFSAV